MYFLDSVSFNRHCNTEVLPLHRTDVQTYFSIIYGEETNDK